jgi:hypothetical protein
MKIPRIGEGKETRMITTNIKGVMGEARSGTYII